MRQDPILNKLVKNLPDEMSAVTVYRDAKMGVYFMFVEVIDKETCCFVHLHDVEHDQGTTYFFGEDPNFAMDMQRITIEKLASAVGISILEDILELKSN